MGIEYKSASEDDPCEIAALFEATFAASENAEEGILIGKLAQGLIETTPDAEIAVFTASENGKTVGSIIFTRLWFEADERQVYLLSPVAISSDQQGLGIGTQLICFGLNMLRDSGVDFAVTYGDPDYYKRVGFEPIGRDLIPAPLPLEQPHGWLAQSLAGEKNYAFDGPSRCAAATISRSGSIFWNFGLMNFCMKSGASTFENKAVAR